MPTMPILERAIEAGEITQRTEGSQAASFHYFATLSLLYNNEIAEYVYSVLLAENTNITPERCTQGFKLAEQTSMILKTQGTLPFCEWLQDIVAEYLGHEALMHELELPYALDRPEAQAMIIKKVVTSLILHAIPESATRIKKIDLSITHYTLLYLLKNIENLPELTHLILHNQRVGDHDITKLCKGLETTQKLVKLDLSYNDISDSGAAALGSLGLKLRALKQVNLSSNNIQFQGAQAIITSFLIAESKDGHPLIELNLAYNDIPPETHPILEEMAKQRRIHLDLSNNATGFKGSAHIKRISAVSPRE